MYVPFQHYAALEQGSSHRGVQYVRFIYGYMGVAGFSIFFFLTGVIALQLLAKTQARLDAFSFLFFLYNFAVRITAASDLPCTLSVHPAPLPMQRQLCGTWRGLHMDFQPHSKPPVLQRLAMPVVPCMSGMRSLTWDQG